MNIRKAQLQQIPGSDPITALYLPQDEDPIRFDTCATAEPNRLMSRRIKAARATRQWFSARRRYRAGCELGRALISVPRPDKGPCRLGLMLAADGRRRANEEAATVAVARKLAVDAT